MKRDRLIITITISIMSIILFAVLFAQFKVVNEVDIAQIEYMSEQELKEALIEWREKYETTETKIKDTVNKIKEYEKKQESNQEARELVKKELAEAKQTFGLTNIEGEGIIVTLKDTEERTYEYKDLLNLVNELRAAGAKAISINNQRIVTTSAIECDGNVIKINGEKIGAPFEIKAIGLPEALININRFGGYAQHLSEDRRLNVSVQKVDKDKITIPKYTGVIKFEYAESK